jgi:uncharacterized membrane protein
MPMTFVLIAHCSTWQMRKAAQRAALEAQANEREAAFRAAMNVCS